MTEPDRTGGGTVTLLFTDIEGSTRLELATGTSRYAALRERHRDLLRAAIAAHRGAQQSTAGDSFFVAFPTARDGVLAAVEAQRALAAEAWPDDAPVRVRMGLHTGEVESAGGDLVGYTINRTARIAAVAHGGQIILSEATSSLVADGLPDDVSLRDLGEHRLKDLRAPERLTQICGAGLQADFPPLRSLDVHPNNLPTQLTSFVGREQELAAALDLLRGTRLLTLTGPGGIGKTRLSLQLAAAAADGFPDGVWFVPLEPVREPDLVAPTIARTMGISERPDRTAVEAIAEEIGTGRVLFVLDNFEQVVAAAPLITQLLGRILGLSIIVSSRAPLHVSGEQEYPVPGLPVPPDPESVSGIERFGASPGRAAPAAPERLADYEAVRLFIARARAVRPSFSLDDPNVATIARIAARLHGMPLAIELAAARMKVLSPEQILARLEDRLVFLAAGSRDLPARQQTLRGAIAWSYELLEPGARRLFDRLAVFRGGCDLETLERVCGPAAEIGADPLDAVSALVDQSLVQAEESTEGIRYAMLDSIRAYAAEMLEASGEEATIRDRHAQVVLELAEQAAPRLSGEDQRAWLDRLERDHDNLRAAVGWAISKRDPDIAIRFAFALWRFWQQRGYLNEAKARLRDLEEADWELTAHQRARLAEACGGIAYWRAERESAKRWYDVALATWRKLGDEREVANALYNRAYADVALLGGEASAEQAEPTRAMLVEALGIYERLGDATGEGNILWALGSLEIFSRNGSAAVEWYRRSLERHRTAGHRTMEAWSLHMLAMSLLFIGDADEARTSAADALRHFRDAGDVAGVTLVLDDLSSVATLDGDAFRAGALWGGARQLEERTGTGLAGFNEAGAAAMGMPTVRAFVAPDDLERYAAIGAAMSLDEIVAFALETLERPPDAAGREAGRHP